MINLRITGYNRIFGPPTGMDDAECTRLHVRVDQDGVCNSAWEPTPADLAALNAGGRIILAVYKCQPPVMLYVEPREEQVA